MNTDTGTQLEDQNRRGNKNIKEGKQKQNRSDMSSDIVTQLQDENKQRYKKVKESKQRKPSQTGGTRGHTSIANKDDIPHSTQTTEGN